MKRDDPDHPILPAAWKYEIIGFHFVRSIDECAEAFIDLTLRREADVKRLRFLAPQDVEIEKGFPRHTHGLVIRDVSARQLEGINVLVDNAENSPGGVRFWARAVIDLEADS